MSNIINDISAGINIIQGLVQVMQKAFHPGLSNETINAIASQANAYCNDVHARHIAPLPTENSNVGEGNG
jgi:hypothetical protein